MTILFLMEIIYRLYNFQKQVDFKNMEQLKKQENYEIQYKTSSQTPNFIKSQILFSQKQAINTIAFPPSQNRQYRVYLLFLFRFIAIITLIFGFSFPSAYSLESTQYHFAQQVRIFSEKLRIFLILFIIINYSLYAYVKYTSSKSLKQLQVHLQILQLTQQLSLHMSGFGVMFEMEINFFLLLISGVLSLICAVDLENYIIREDLMYKSSMSSEILFYILLLLTYILNGIAVYIEDFASSRLVSCLAGLIFAAWYFSQGYLLYIYKETRTLLLLFVCSLAAVGYVAAESYFIQETKFDQRNLLKIFLFASMIFLAFKMVEKKILQAKLMSVLSSTGNTPSTELALIIAKNSLEGSQYSLMMVGLLKKYEEEGSASNQKSLLTEKFLFDSLTETHLMGQQLLNVFDSYMKFIVKEKYQTQEEEKSKIVDFKIKYCQFLLNEMPNFTQALATIAFVQRSPVSFIQKKAIQKIKWYVSERSKKLSSNLDDSTLKLESLVQSESIVDEIQSLLKQYIYKYLMLWQLVEARSQNINTLKKIFNQAAAILTTLEDRWEKLTIFLPYNQSWKELLIYYLLYIRNEQLHQKTIEEHTKNVRNDPSLNAKPIWRNPSKYSSLFDSRSIVFHAVYKQQQLVLINVSKRFSFNLKWTKDEMVGANLSTLLPQEMKNQHQTIFQKWYKNGHQTSQSSYKRVFTHCLDKDGKELPVEKSFKPFINYSLMDVQFICLLVIKKNEDSDARQPLFTPQATYNALLTKDQVSRDTSAKIPIEKSIFLKEDAFNPTNELAQVSKIKKAMRLYSILMVISIIALALVDYTNSVYLNEYSEEYINFMQLYRYPIVLGNDYYSKLLNIGNQATLTRAIGIRTQKFRFYLTNLKTIRTVFNKQLNKPHNYYITNKDNLTNTMNQIDLFFSMSSIITTVSNSSLSVQRFIEENISDFFSMLQPSYDNMLNSTKFQFHETFVRSLQTINNSIYLTIGIQAFILIFMSIFGIFTVIIYFRRVKEIIRTIIQFNSDHLKSIKTYWIKIILIFQGYTAKNTHFHSEQQFSYHKLRSSNLSDRYLGNQRSKKVKLSIESQNNYFQKQQKRFKIKTITLILITNFTIFSILVITQAIFSLKFQQILDFQDDGFSFLKYFPTSAIVCLGCLEKTFSVRYPSLSNFQATNYEDALSNLWISGNFQYVTTIRDQSSQYQKKRLNYFFGNPCSYNPNISSGVGITAKKCELVLESSLKRGLCGFMRTAYQYSKDCLYGTEGKSNQWLNDFSQGVILLSAYLQDVIDTWGGQFTAKISSTLRSFFMVTIFQMFFIVCLHLVVFQRIILKQVASQYEFYKKFYINMVPQFVLEKDKIAKQKFLQNKIIEIK